MLNQDRVLAYRPIAQFIADVCGPRCEVVLHSLEDMKHTIIFIANGHVSGRAVGDTLLDYTTDIAFPRAKAGDPYIVNLPAKVSKNGRKIRSSDFFIRDDTGIVIGLMSINIDVTDIEVMMRFAEAELRLMETPYTQEKQQSAEKEDFPLSVNDLVESLIEQTLAEMSCKNPNSLKKEEKMQIISVLNERNLFVIKGIVSLVAKRIHVSEPSIYRYLKELKDNSN